MSSKNLISNVFNHVAFLSGYVMGAFTLGAPTGAVAAVQAKNYLDCKLNS